jgi:hypothetical protein
MVHGSTYLLLLHARKSVDVAFETIVTKMIVSDFVLSLDYVLVSILLDFYVRQRKAGDKNTYKDQTYT